MTSIMTMPALIPVSATFEAPVITSISNGHVFGGLETILAMSDPIADAKNELRGRMLEIQKTQQVDVFKPAETIDFNKRGLSEPLVLYPKVTSRSVFDYRVWQHPRDMSAFRSSDRYRSAIKGLMASMDAVVSAGPQDDYHDSLYDFILILRNFIDLPLQDPKEAVVHDGDQKWIYYVAAWDSIDLLWATVMNRGNVLGSLYAGLGQIIGAIGVKLLLSSPELEPLSSYQKVLDRLQQMALMLEQRIHSRYAIEVSRELRLIGIDLLSLSAKANSYGVTRNKTSDAIQSHLDLAFSYGNIAPSNNYKALQHFKSAIDLGLEINSKLARAMYQLLRDGFEEVGQNDQSLAVLIVNNYLKLQDFENPEDKLEAQMLLGLVYAQKYVSRMTGYEWIRRALTEYKAAFSPRTGGLSDYPDLSVDTSWNNISVAPAIILSLFEWRFSIQSTDIPFKCLSLWIYDCLGNHNAVDSLLTQIFRFSWQKHKSSRGLSDISDELRVWPSKYYKKLVNILSNAHRSWDDNDKECLNGRMVKIYKSWSRTNKRLFNTALRMAAEKYTHCRLYQFWFLDAV